MVTPNLDQVDSPGALAMILFLCISIAVGIALSFLGYFLAKRLLKNWNVTEGSNANVPPIPMAAEFDPEVSPDQRVAELRWLEALMESPSRGEDVEGPQR